MIHHRPLQAARISAFLASSNHPSDDQSRECYTGCSGLVHTWAEKFWVQQPPMLSKIPATKTKSLTKSSKRWRNETKGIKARPLQTQDSRHVQNLRTRRGKEKLIRQVTDILLLIKEGSVVSIRNIFRIFAK